MLDFDQFSRKSLNFQQNSFHPLEVCAGVLRGLRRAAIGGGRRALRREPRADPEAPAAPRALRRHARTGGRSDVDLLQVRRAEPHECVRAARAGAVSKCLQSMRQCSMD